MSEWHGWPAKCCHIMIEFVIVAMTGQNYRVDTFARTTHTIIIIIVEIEINDISLTRQRNGEIQKNHRSSLGMACELFEGESSNCLQLVDGVIEKTNGYWSECRTAKLTDQSHIPSICRLCDKYGFDIKIMSCLRLLSCVGGWHCPVPDVGHLQRSVVAFWLIHAAEDT